MPYDEALARRIRALLQDQPDISERKMFGGIAFMAGENMCVGVTGADVMARVGAEKHDEALTRPGVRQMDFTGRPMKGFVFVSGAGISEEALEGWVAGCLAFVRALPPKKAGKAMPRAPRSA